MKSSADDKKSGAVLESLGRAARVERDVALDLDTARAAKYLTAEQLERLMPKGTSGFSAVEIFDKDAKMQPGVLYLEEDLSAVEDRTHAYQVRYLAKNGVVVETSEHFVSKSESKSAPADRGFMTIEDMRLKKRVSEVDKQELLETILRQQSLNLPQKLKILAPITTDQKGGLQLPGLDTHIEDFKNSKIEEFIVPVCPAATVPGQLHWRNVCIRQADNGKKWTVEITDSMGAGREVGQRVVEQLEAMLKSIKGEGRFTIEPLVVKQPTRGQEDGFQCGDWTILFAHKRAEELRLPHDREMVEAYDASQLHTGSSVGFRSLMIEKTAKMDGRAVRDVKAASSPAKKSSKDDIEGYVKTAVGKASKPSLTAADVKELYESVHDESHWTKSSSKSEDKQTQEEKDLEFAKNVQRRLR